MVHKGELMKNKILFFIFVIVASLGIFPVFLFSQENETIDYHSDMFSGGQFIGFRNTKAYDPYKAVTLIITSTLMSNMIPRGTIFSSEASWSNNFSVFHSISPKVGIFIGYWMNIKEISVKDELIKNFQNNINIGVNGEYNNFNFEFKYFHFKEKGNGLKFNEISLNGKFNTLFNPGIGITYDFDFNKEKSPGCNINININENIPLEALKHENIRLEGDYKINQFFKRTGWEQFNLQISGPILLEDLLRVLKIDKFLQVSEGKTIITLVAATIYRVEEKKFYGHLSAQLKIHIPFL